MKGSYRWLRLRWTRFVQVSLVVVVWLWPVITHAQKALVACSGLDCKISHLLDLPVRIYNFALGFAGLVALLFIIWGGFQMLIHGFDENPGKALEEAKYTVRRAIFGLVIIACAYLLVSTVLTFLGLQCNPLIDRFLQSNCLLPTG